MLRKLNLVLCTLVSNLCSLYSKSGYLILTSILYSDIKFCQLYTIYNNYTVPYSYSIIISQMVVPVQKEYCQLQFNGVLVPATILLLWKGRILYRLYSVQHWRSDSNIFCSLWIILTYQTGSFANSCNFGPPVCSLHNITMPNSCI